MVKACRNTVIALTFIVVVTINILWDFMNSYVACGLALAVSVAAGFCVERAFIKCSHRETVRREGADWSSANDQQPGT
ncbi:hypothetical protein A1D31_35660 [Bradyrhizobium liaoningense]|nr:hypothetical protein A1D31_35660 [Bradyrhizobium liaoningense]